MVFLKIDECINNVLFRFNGRSNDTPVCKIPPLLWVTPMS